MNEKLQQEIKLVQDNFRQIGASDDAIISTEGIARHFYNLALADVREMITRQQKANHTGTDEWIRAKSIAYESVCDFIDNLTK